MIRIIYIITLLTFIFIGCEDLFKNDTIYGCLDEDACNYSSIANTSDSDLCDYPMENFNCDDECIVEVDDCGVCGGSGLDDDDDEICDDIDPCLGEYSSDGSYFCDDVHVLFDFINSNPSLDSCLIIDGKIVSSDGNTLGIIDWEDDASEPSYRRLVELRLSYLDLTLVPSSIGNLDFLELLYLNNNELSSLPETLCDIPSTCEIYLQYNNLCPEYDPDNNDSPWYCIYQFSNQDCQE